MPNRVYIRLHLTGTEDNIDKFMKENIKYRGDIEEEYLDFGVVVPLGDEYDRDLAEKMWGTRSTGLDVYTGEKDGHTFISFFTINSPCTEWFEKAIEKYPEIIFTIIYNDENNEDFYGWGFAVNGKLVDGEFICLHLGEESNNVVDIYKFDREKNNNTNNGSFEQQLEDM